METLTTSVSVSTFRHSTTTTTTTTSSALPVPTFKPPSSSSSSRHPNLLPRRNSISNQRHPSPQPHQILTKTSSPSKTTTTTISTNITTRHRASSGYAAALLDISLCQKSTDLLFKDATRCAHLIRAKPVLELMRNPFVNVTEKNQTLNEVIENGKFEKHFSALLKMLIMKNKFGIIGEVLDEFRGMYYELCLGSYKASVA